LNKWTVLDALWCAVLMAFVMAGTVLVPFHGDESTLIYMSRDYAYQFIDRDLERIAYDATPQDNPDTEFATQQELRLLNGTIPKYWMGFTWHVAGYGVDDLNNQWVWGPDYAYNLANGHIPSPDLLQTVRFGTALLMALAVPAAFGIGWTIGGDGGRGRTAAYAVSLLFALNPALLLNGRRAMMESALMLFSLLTVLAAMRFLRARRWWPLLGVAIGMAVASKHTAIMTVLPVVAALGLALFWRGWHDRRRLLPDFAALIAAGCVALLVFYALNPAWWGDPVERAQHVLALRTELLGGQLGLSPNYVTLPDRLAGFADAVLIGRPQYFEIVDWAAYIPDEIAAYEASPWFGLGGSVIWGVVMALLTLCGMIALIRGAKDTAAARWVLALWVFGACVMVIALTPFYWQRYYIPAILPVVVLAGSGAGQIYALVAPRFARNGPAAGR
jgi:4-amino-4-deoxy-L-arabinose transferase-like glycosyltransferase